MTSFDHRLGNHLPGDSETGHIFGDNGNSTESEIAGGTAGGSGSDASRFMNTLEQVALLVRHCTDCPLSGGRTNAVPGEGNPNAEVMFIGEGPGFQEDRQGRPFVGRAGKYLDSLLASIGISRDDLFIANMVKCRPPENRAPARQNWRHAPSTWTGRSGW